MRVSNLSNLVADAVRYREASASSGKWRAYRDIPACSDEPDPHGELVSVWHHATRMMVVWPNVAAIPLDPGYGSTTDRCGVRRITEGAGCGIGYRELYGEGK
jgi:hypothetical protein